VTARLPVGVLGVGALGQHHARHLAGLSDVRLVGVCDVDRARATKIAGELGTVAFTDMDELLAKVEAVTVAVPTPAHAEVGIRALRRGVPVLMEKPLTATLAEADALIAEARRRRVQLQVGHIERYNRAIRAAEAYLDGPRYIESLRLAPFQPRGTDVAVVLDLMIHDLDLVLHLTGSVATEVRASGLPVLSPHLDIANARVEFANGAVALATASRVARERIRRLRLFQPNGYFSLDLATGGGEFMRVRAGWQPGTGRELADVVERIELAAPEADALLLELQSFVHAVRGEREVVVRGEEGRAALELALRVADAVRTPPLAVTAH
jgi:predicted dehydrogenase